LEVVQIVSFPGLSKKVLKMTTKVVDALGRDRRIERCLGQNERASDGSLRVGARFSPVYFPSIPRCRSTSSMPDISVEACLQISRLQASRMVGRVS
jgi:hypothetical protein